LSQLGFARRLSEQLTPASLKMTQWKIDSPGSNPENFVMERIKSRATWAVITLTMLTLALIAILPIV